MVFSCSASCVALYSHVLAELLERFAICALLSRGFAREVAAVAGSGTTCLGVLGEKSEGPPSGDVRGGGPLELVPGLSQGIGSAASRRGDGGSSTIQPGR